MVASGAYSYERSKADREEKVTNERRAGQKGRKALSQRDRIRGRVPQARKDRVDGTRTVR